MSLLTTTCPVLTALHIDLEKDRMIHIKEGTLADGNFLLTYIMRNIFISKVENSMCLVNIHNTIGHYQNVGKRLRFDLMEEIKHNFVANINLLQDARQYIMEQQDPVAYLMKNVKEQILTETDKLLQSNKGNVFLVIDDLSHFLDLHVPYSEMLKFINFCVSLLENERIYVVIGNHCTEENNSKDTLLSNLLSYASDVDVAVSSLKTGACPGVSGIISLRRHGSNEEVYHFKTHDRDVKVFNPGAALTALQI